MGYPRRRELYPHAMKPSQTLSRLRACELSIQDRTINRRTDLIRKLQMSFFTMLKNIRPRPGLAKKRHVMCLIWSDGEVIRETHVSLPLSAENMLWKGLMPLHAEIWRHCGPASDFMRPTTPQSQCLALLSLQKARPENED